MIDWLPRARWSALKRERDSARFSEYLPWFAYGGDEDPCYLSLEGAEGYIFECTPAPFLSAKAAGSLEGLFRLPLPEDGVIQISLVSDGHIQPALEAYRSFLTRTDNPVLPAMVERYSQFLAQSATGLEAAYGIPVRRFRIFVTLKAGERPSEDVITQAAEFLAGAGLAPRPLRAGALLAWARRLFNASVGTTDEAYDPTRPIQQQVIQAECQLRFDADKVVFARPDATPWRIGRCLTPKHIPKDIDLLQQNELCGGVMGAISDTEQITTPFIYTLNICFDDTKAQLYHKAAVTSMQKIAGSLAQRLARKVEEFQWAVDALERQRFFRFIPVLWVFGRDNQEASHSVARVKRMWENRGYVMQEEQQVLAPFLLQALPLGFYYDIASIRQMDRHFFAPPDTLACQLPVQADFTGGGNALVPFIGRKGQLSVLDIFDKRANNHNMLAAASTGSGKSFLFNYLMYNYYKSGAMVRIIDIGYSYRKTCRMLRGKYIDVGARDVVMNPFDTIRTPEDDIPVVAAIIAQMVYSNEARSPTESEWTLLKDAVHWAWQQGRSAEGIDLVQTYLRRFPEHSQYEINPETMTDVVRRAHEMAFNLHDFTREGKYGRFFNGRSSIDIAHDPFVVLELEALSNRPELFRVVTLQVINTVTQELYLSRDIAKRFILFDEAWQFLSEFGGDDDSPVKPVIEGGYRRARKYNGSFSIVTQSLLDMRMFGAVGDVIRNNSAFKFYLESDDYEACRKAGLLDYGDFDMELLKSIKSSRGRYSEIYIDTPFGRAAQRLIVDRFSYYLFTSDRNDNAAIEQLIQAGYSELDALRIMAGELPRPEGMTIEVV